jgi:hypothetical protein
MRRKGLLSSFNALPKKMCQMGVDARVPPAIISPMKEGRKESEEIDACGEFRILMFQLNVC